MSGADQLFLKFDHRPSLGGHDFLVTETNRRAIEWLDRWPDWPTPALVIYGPSGCGKSHLAHVFAARSSAKLIAGRALSVSDPVTAVAGQPVSIIDDADKITDETLLLHLYNAAVAADIRIFMTAETPPARWQINLPDLASRLRSASVEGIGLPDDELICAVLAKQFSDRQLRVDRAVIDYVLPRMERSLDAVRRLVDEIDQKSLSAKRNVTLPLVRELIEEQHRNG